MLRDDRILRSLRRLNIVGVGHSYHCIALNVNKLIAQTQGCKDGFDDVKSHGVLSTAGIILRLPRRRVSILAPGLIRLIHLHILNGSVRDGICWMRVGMFAKSLGMWSNCGGGKLRRSPLFKMTEI